MKRVIVLIMLMLVLVLIVNATPPEKVGAPFNKCENYGLKPDIKQEYESLKDKMMNGEPMDEAETMKLRYYLTMGTECCSLTLDEEACKQSFQDEARIRAKERAVPYMMIIIASVLLIIPTAYLILFHKKVNKKVLKKIFLNLAIIFIVLGIIIFLVYLSIVHHIY